MKSNNNLPFLLAPSYSNYAWGGRRLIDDFGKVNGQGTLAESWEFSTDLKNPCFAGSGEHKGKYLSQILSEHPEYLGAHPSFENSSLPLSIRFIDAKEGLSSCFYKPLNSNSTKIDVNLRIDKLIYVLDAGLGSFFSYGFKHRISKERFLKLLSLDSLDKFLNKTSIQKNDVLLIEPGVIHSFGPNSLLIDIQATFDLDLRTISQEKDYEKQFFLLNNDINLNANPASKSLIRALKFKPGRAIETLLRSELFQVDRMLINTERTRTMVSHSSGLNTFQVFICYSGCGVLESVEQEPFLNFFKGDCIFVPANSVDFKIHGKAEFLRIRC